MSLWRFLTGGTNQTHTRNTLHSRAVITDIFITEKQRMINRTLMNDYNVIDEWPLTPAICLIDSWSHLFPAARASTWKDENTDAGVSRDGETTGHDHALWFGPDHQLKSFPGGQTQRYMISLKQARFLLLRAVKIKNQNLSLAKCLLLHNVHPFKSEIKYI